MREINELILIPDMAFITILAVIDAKKIVTLEFFIAIMADIKNVLSPNSENIITVNDAMNAWAKRECIKRDQNVLVWCLKQNKNHNFHDNKSD